MQLLIARSVLLFALNQCLYIIMNGISVRLSMYINGLYTLFDLLIVVTGLRIVISQLDMSQYSPERTRQ